MRRLAQSNALRLNEWGLFDIKSDQKISGESEEQLYNELGLEWIPPELRENSGEIEIAKKGSKEWQEKMKGLIKYGDIKGDLQVTFKQYGRENVNRRNGIFCNDEF